MRNIQLQGFDEYIRKLDRLPKELKQEAGAIVKDAAGLWEERAKLSAPTDQGPLKQRISIKELGEMSWEIVSPQEYSPYMEWGTKSKVSVPADLVDYAQTFRGKRTPGGAKAIYEWCRRVGIPQNAWVFVYLSIMKYGVTPHPFFFIHGEAVRTQLMNDLKQLLEGFD